ncbi:inovirus Gp2 family protein [Enterobacter hormaechei]|uniref:inovirus Gp2 family protein n=1 Tax=Enterobacter hormaechei TaxID=158836 RepID=UPI002A75468F|nr:inovirus Gp2 family protein [Enterobacter hormaechei]MDY3572486.1 inovirus Gp2 family protein [Enterobacter hormaechei]
MYTYNTSHGELNKYQLKRIKQTIDNALEEHARTIAIRVDLYTPLMKCLCDMPTEDNFAKVDASVISRFMTSLKEKIKYDLIKREKEDKRVRKTTLRFIWSREFCPTTHKKHYHTLLLLNRDMFSYLGSFENDKGTLLRLIREAWMSATGLIYPRSKELVEIPKNPIYHLNAKDGDQSKRYKDLIYRTSYFAKYKSKNFTDGERNFGCSQG